MNNVKFTDAELSKIREALKSHVDKLLYEYEVDDEITLFIIRDYINIYEKVADYVVEEME